jgi:ribosomal protein S18 acetylase RimI-like enzyme
MRPGDEVQIQDLVLQGLAQRFGVLRADLNPDLGNLKKYYLDWGASIVVAEDQGRIIACGMLIHEEGSAIIARIVRMSVHPDYQRRGIGRLIASSLLDIARERGFLQVVTETNSDWDSALRLYQSLGFREYMRRYVPEFDFTEVHMSLNLPLADLDEATH